jgi:hypothetical protein
MQPRDHSPGIVLSRLREPFPSSDIEWKPGSVTKDRKKGLAMPFITNRAIQDRLDDVCGASNWRNAYRPGPDGGVLCGISINVTGDPLTPCWITKWDGADNNDYQGVKGGLSAAMKRAAVQWGIGRYLYAAPARWIPLDDRGRFAEQPRLPSALLPRAPRPAPSRPPRDLPRARSDRA